MIYTVTVNPALDYTMRLEDLTPGTIQKSYSEDFYAGGKGINVSNILTQLAIPNVAMGFIAGFTGDEIERLVSEQGIISEFVRLPTGTSRINVKIRTAGESCETDINAVGSDIDPASLEELYKKLSKVSDGDMLVLAGSIPESVPENIYETIIEKLKGRKVDCVVDATGDLLRNSLKNKPFLIKPNKEELEDFFGTKIHTDGEILHYAKEMRQYGARNVLVSKGDEGAVLLCETEEFFKVESLKGCSAVNTVGAGDAMVAGFLAGWLNHRDYKQALVWGTAAGAATAFCEGIAMRNDILGLIRQVKMPEQI